MMYSNCYSPMSSIKNCATIKTSNTPSYKSLCSTTFIGSACLILNQYANKKRLRVGSSLVYHIYVINNLKCDINNIILRDVLPRGVKLLETTVENGQYKQCENEVFYNINVIEPHSFCKITISVVPVTLGKKINTIDVICEKSKCAVNSPCKICSEVNLNDEDCK